MNASMHEGKTHIIPYTISNLRQLSRENKISHELMPKIRQNSYIHCPCINDNMVVLVAIKTETDSIVGYMGILPELLQKPNIRVSWGITLFVDSKYRGKGYAGILNSEIQSRAEGTYLVINHVPTTAHILKKQGNEELFYEKCQLYVSFRNEYRGKFLSLKSVINDIHKQLFRRYPKQHHSLDKIELEYVKCLDEETYCFILKHSTGDMFVRSQDMLNWILQYPFTVEAPLTDKTNKSYSFAYSYKTNTLYAVKVYFQKELIGFLMFKNRDGDLVLLYRYFKDIYREYIYVIIAEHINVLRPQIFTTTDMVLVDFLKQQLKPIRVLHSKFRLSFPKQHSGIDVENGYIQGGDGDMFI